MGDMHIDKIAEAVVAIDNNKLYIVSFVIIILIISYTLRWYFNSREKKQMTSSLDRLSISINNLSNTVANHEMASSGRTDKLTNVMEEIRDRQKNVIGKADSIRIIISKFNDVIKKEIISILEWSISNNDYEHRQKFIKRRVKTELAEAIRIAKCSVGEFKLSVDIDKFFVTYINEQDRNIHTKMVDLIWDAVEETYHKDRYKGSKTEVLLQQLEEMRISVDNVINAELSRIQSEVNNIY